MIHTISRNITEFLVKYSVEDKCDLHWKVCCYGIEVTISTLLNCLIVFLIGIFFNMFAESIVFLAAFTPLRIYSGGYHADTYLKCNLIFGILVFGCFAVYKYANPVYQPEMIAICTIQLLMCVFYAPIENKNKKLTNRQKKMYKQRAITAILILCSLLFLSEIKIICELNIVSYAVLLNILFMFFGIIRRKKNEVNEKQNSGTH